MPLAYVGNNVATESVLTEEVNNYLGFLRKKESEIDYEDKEYSIAIGIDINFKKSSAINGIGMR